MAAIAGLTAVTMSIGWIGYIVVSVTAITDGSLRQIAGWAILTPLVLACERLGFRILESTSRF